MAKKVLAIQNARCETLGTFEGILNSYGYEPEVIDATRLTGLPDSTDYKAIVILGGPMSVYDGTSPLEVQMQLIRKSIEHKVPVLGVCLGSQLIAQAAGGTVYKGARKEIGWRPIRTTKEGKQTLLDGLEDPFWIFQWHGDTYQLPDSAKLLAYSDMYPQAFRIGSAVGIQFHVEVDQDLIRSWLSEYRKEVDSEELRPDEVVGDQRLLDNLPKTCSRVMANFLQHSGL